MKSILRLFTIAVLLFAFMVNVPFANATTLDNIVSVFEVTHGFDVAVDDTSVLSVTVDSVMTNSVMTIDNVITSTYLSTYICMIRHGTNDSGKTFNTF